MTVNNSQRTVNGDFKKGFSGNPKGKPKGAKNKITKSSKETMEETIQKAGSADRLLKFMNKSNGNEALVWGWYFSMLPKNAEMAHSGSIRADMSIKDLKESIKNYENGSDKR